MPRLKTQLRSLMEEQRLTGLAFQFTWNDQLTNTVFRMNMLQVLINLILFCRLIIFEWQSKSLGEIVLFTPSPS